MRKKEAKALRLSATQLREVPSSSQAAIPACWLPGIGLPPCLELLRAGAERAGKFQRDCEGQKGKTPVCKLTLSSPKISLRDKSGLCVKLIASPRRPASALCSACLGVCFGAMSTRARTFGEEELPVVSFSPAEDELPVVSFSPAEDIPAIFNGDPRFRLAGWPPGSCCVCCVHPLSSLSLQLANSRFNVRRCGAAEAADGVEWR